MSIDFNKLGGRVLGDIPKPPVEPAGTYHGVIQKWEFSESPWKNKETQRTEAQVKFTIKPTEFGDNIDEDSRAGINLREKLHIGTMGIETDAQIYYMQEFLRNMGVEVAGKSLAQALPELLSAQVSYDVQVKSGEKGDLVNIRKIRPRERA